MLNSSPSRKRHEQDGKEDLAGAWETRTIGSGLRGHSDNQIRPLKPDDRPETTKEHARRETEEEDTVRLSEGSGRKQTNNQHKMTTVVSGGLPLRFWYQTSSRCIVHAFG